MTNLFFSVSHTHVTHSLLPVLASPPSPQESPDVMWFPSQAELCINVIKFYDLKRCTHTHKPTLTPGGTLGGNCVCVSQLEIDNFDLLRSNLSDDIFSDK